MTDQHDTEVTTTGDAVFATGATYRQLDHWINRGWLRVPHRPGGTGSGYHRHWTTEELAVAATMARLVKARIPPDVAERIARGHPEVRDVFRYFCGVAWNMVNDLRERAAAVVETRASPRPQAAGPSIENIIADAIDRVGAGTQIDPWVYDDLVYDAADNLRKEQARQMFPDLPKGA